MKLIVGLLMASLSVGAYAQERILQTQSNIEVADTFCDAYGSLSEKIMQHRQQGIDRQDNERALDTVLREIFPPEEDETRVFTQSALNVSVDRAYKEPQAPQSQWGVVSQTFGQRQKTQCLQELRNR